MKNKQQKRFSHTLTKMATMTLLSSITLSATASQSSLSDGLAAVINESPILKSELNSAVNQTIQQYSLAGQPAPNAAEIKKDVLDGLVVQQLQQQLLQRSNYKPSDDAINKRILEIAKAQGWDSIATLKQNLNKDGKNNYAYLRNNVIEQLSVQSLQQSQVGNRVTITDAEVDAFLSTPAAKAINEAPSTVIPQWRTRHILIKVDDKQSNETAKQKIDELYELLRQGGDFASLAAIHSQDPGSVENGGDLDWVMEGVMVPEFEDMMKRTPTTDFSTPFRTAFGWHILKVEDTRKKDITDTVKRNMAKDIIFQQKAPAAFDAWINDLKSNAYIRFFE